MAIYEYQCTNEDCEEIFNQMVSANAEEKERLEQKCPKCGSLGKRTWGIGAIYMAGIKGMTRRKIGGKTEKSKKSVGE